MIYKARSNLIIILINFNLISSNLALSGISNGGNTIILVQEGKTPSRYIEYLEGTGLPVILAAPHGGLEEPLEIPDRVAGCWDSAASSCVWNHDCGEKNLTKCKAVTVTDGYTADLTREVRQVLCSMFEGLCPALVINLLKRTKLDANRAIEEATFNQSNAVDAFNTFHGHIEREKKKLENQFEGDGRGLFIDIHGQSHDIERAELGYLLRGAWLDSDQPLDYTNTSIRSLVERFQNKIPFNELLRGNASFGALLEAMGYRAVPSPTDRGPGGHVYFNGGYNTRVHGSWSGGRIDAIQIESAHRPRMPEHRAMYSRALACTIARFVCMYYVDYVNVTAHTEQSSRSVSSSSGTTEKVEKQLENEEVSVPENLCIKIDTLCTSGGIRTLYSSYVVTCLLLFTLILVLRS